MSFITKVNPAGAVGDLLTVWRQAGSNRYAILAAACLPALIMVYTFYKDMQEKAAPPPPQVIYVESWPADRSMEQILADQAEREKARIAAEERQRERYKALGRAVGMDVEEIEREAKAEAAAAGRTESTERSSPSGGG